MGATCQQVLSQWDEPCPLEPAPDEQYCYLHLPPAEKHQEQVRDAIREYFSLDHPVISDAHIDSLALDDSLFRDLRYNDVKFYNCDIGTLRLSNVQDHATYDFTVAFIDCTIDELQAIDYDHYGEILFQGGSIAEVFFLDTTFHAAVRFHAPITGKGHLRRCTFEDDLEFGYEWILDDDWPGVLLRACTVSQLTGPRGGRQVPLVIRDGAVASVQHLDFDATSFRNVVLDGVDFAALENQLRQCDSPLFESTVERLPEGCSASVSSLVRKNTYQKARAAASGAGATSMASYFFRREKIFNRQNHAERARTADSLADRAKAVESWIANFILGATTGHGQIPRRVVATSAFIIFTFAGLFYLISPVQPYGSLLGYLILSIESFVTLVLSSQFTVDSESVRLLAEIEGFIGVFMAGLFIFTLTSSLQH